MAFKDYSTTPANNTALGDGTYIGPDMLRNKVRPAFQQIAADGRSLYDEMLEHIATPTATPFMQAGAGAVNRTYQNKLRETVSVKDFGAIGDGVTDDTAAVQLAFNQGGHIRFPRGTYKVSAPLSITNQIMVTAGMGAAVIVTSSATANVIEITGPTPASGAANVTIDGLQFNTSVTRTAGAYIQVSNGVYNVDISRCRFTSAFDAVRNTGVGGFGFYVRNCIFYYTRNISVLIDNSAPAVEMLLENLNILGPSPTLADAVAGVKVTCAGDLTLRHVMTVKSGRGLWIGPTAGVRVQLMWVDHCAFDSGADWALYCVTNGGRVDALKITKTWSGTSSGGGGFYFGSAAPEPYTNNEIRYLEMSGNTGVNNLSQQGFRFGPNVTDATIIGNLAAGNTLDGFLFDANTSGFTLIGNRAGPAGEFGPNGGKGIHVAAGTSNNYIITNNRVSGNTGANVTDGGTGVNKVVENNI